MPAKKIFFLTVMILALSFNSYSSVISFPVIALSNIIPGETPNSKQKLMIMQMKWFVHLTSADYEKLRGKKLNFIERVAFKLNQRRMKQMLKHYKEEPGIFNKIGWLVKGLLFGPLAVLLAYIFLRDDDRELIKWVWFGFAGWAIILVALLVSLG